MSVLGSRIPIIAATVLILVFFFFGENASADQSANKNWSLGPFEISNQYPLAHLHNSFTPRSPEVLQENSAHFQSHFSWSNTFNRKESYHVDTESRVLESELEYGLTSELALRARVPITWRGGGVLDGPIDSWHDTFGLPEGHRDEVGKDEYAIYGLNKDLSSFDLPSNGIRLGDITLGLQYLHSQGDDVLPAISTYSELRLPTASDSYGQDSVDYGTGVLVSKALWDLFFYSGLGYTYFGSPDTSGLLFERHHLSAFVGAEFPLIADLSAYTSVLYESALLRDLPNFPEYQTYIDLGFKYRSSPVSYELYIRENPGPSKGTTDFTCGLGMSVYLW